jgi:hypothetical protein
MSIDSHCRPSNYYILWVSEMSIVIRNFMVFISDFMSMGINLTTRMCIMLEHIKVLNLGLIMMINTLILFMIQIYTMMRHI